MALLALTTMLVSLNSVWVLLNLRLWTLMMESWTKNLSLKVWLWRWSFTLLSACLCRVSLIGP